MDNHGAEDQVSATVHGSDGDSSRSLSSPELFRDFVVNGMVRLFRVEERGYDVIKDRFLLTMALYGEGTELVAVHKILYTSGSGKARLEGFGSLRKEVAAKRGGDANAKFVWYGGSGAEICDVLRYGCVSHGVGVYLSPEHSPIDSVMRAKEDENGIRHMLLCDIILGKTETIPAGSEQVYPSSTDFDSGVDNPLMPRTYIIWNAYMNSHILPVSIYSFKAPFIPGIGKMNIGGMGMGAGHGGGSGPTAAAAAAAAQKQETFLQRVDTDITNLVDNFQFIVNAAQVNDSPVQNSQESSEMDMRAARMVQSAESLLELVSELKKNAISSGMASLNDHVDQRTDELNKLTDDTNRKLSRIGEEVAASIKELESHYYSSTLRTSPITPPHEPLEKDS